MYNVRDDVIEAFKSDGVHKEFKVVINGNTYYNDQIVDDSFQLKQSILDSEQFEAVGCIASNFSIDLRAQFPTKIRGSEIQVYIRPVIPDYDTWEPMFYGYIDKCEKTANGWNRHIEAYDILYNLSGQSGQADENEKKKYDVTEWYNTHVNTNIDWLLRTLCQKFGISVVDGNKPLVNGSVITTCGKVRKATNLSALELLKEIMRVNGCFGYIRRDGMFSWKYLETGDTEYGLLYPSGYTYPGPDTFTGSDPNRSSESKQSFIGEYEGLKYQDFQMLPIDCVKVRNFENDEEQGSYGSGENTYIIQGNVLILDASKSQKSAIAENIYNALNGTFYVPFSVDHTNGFPYLECGDDVGFWDFIGDNGQASVKRFYILNRTMKGGQHLVDSFSAEGNEYLHEFITGQANNSSVDELREEMEENYPSKEEVADMIEEAEKDSVFKIVSIYADELPAIPNSNTLYCIRGEQTLVDSLGSTEEQEEPTDPNQNDSTTEPSG